MVDESHVSDSLHQVAKAAQLVHVSRLPPHASPARPHNSMPGTLKPTAHHLRLADHDLHAIDNSGLEY